MGNFFASLRSSHALRWLLIWGVVILLVILLLRYISQKHAAANGMTTSGSGLGSIGGSSGSDGSGGSGGSSTNINISITDAISNAFARLRRQPTPAPASQPKPGGVGSAGPGGIHTLPAQPRPGSGGRPLPAQPRPGSGGVTKPPTKGLRSASPVQAPPAQRYPTKGLRSF